MGCAGKTVQGATWTLQKIQAVEQAVLVEIDKAEARVGAIDAMFCKPDYDTRTPGDEVRALEGERTRLQGDVAELLTEWEKLEATIAELE